MPELQYMLRSHTVLYGMGFPDERKAGSATPWSLTNLWLPVGVVGHEEETLLRSQT